MRRQRPGVVTTFGILNIVFGVLGIVCTICGGVALFGVMALASNLPKNEFNFPPFPDKVKSLTVVDMALGTVMAIALIVAGIGLLGMKPWARLLSLAYGGVKIVL